MREQASTYFVEDRSSKEERRRLEVQDRLLTHGMGGALAEQPGALPWQRLLDVGCGTGGWLRDVALMLPQARVLVGVDISESMLAHARSETALHRLNDRVEFAAMDALRMLEFPSDFFDLANQRLGISYLRTWDWPRLLQEMYRVLCFGGIIRLTELEFAMQSSSEALNALWDLVRLAMWRAGHLFSETGASVIEALPNLLSRAGFQQIQKRPVFIAPEPGSEGAAAFIEDQVMGFRTLRPFLQKWGQMPPNYEEMYQVMLQEIQHEGFQGGLRLCTVWGRKEWSLPAGA